MSSCGTFLRHNFDMIERKRSETGWRELNPHPKFFNLLIMKGYFEYGSIMYTRRAHMGQYAVILQAIKALQADLCQ